jgi:hypothetical protein
MMTMMTTSGTVKVIPDAAGANPFGKSSLTKSFSPAREAPVSSRADGSGSTRLYFDYSEALAGPSYFNL